MLIYDLERHSERDSVLKRGQRPELIDPLSITGDVPLCDGRCPQLWPLRSSDYSLDISKTAVPPSV